MAANQRRESLRENAAMRREVKDGATLKQVGAKRGITAERVRQRAGNTGRRPNWPATRRKTANLQRVEKLLKAGKTNRQIEAATELSASTIYAYRHQLGLPSRPTLLQAQAHTVWCAWMWYELYGYTPAAVDWHPSQARRTGQPDRAVRFLEFKEKYKAPDIRKVLRQFDGKWLAMIELAGLPPAPQGAAGRVVWQKRRSSE